MVHTLAGVAGAWFIRTTGTTVWRSVNYAGQWSYNNLEINSTKNVGQCPTWWPPCRILVAPSVQRRKVWLMPNTGMPCSNAAKMRNPLKFAGVPQTRQQISAASGPSSPYYQDMWRRYCCLTSFFPIVDTCLSCEDIAWQSCGMVPRWRLFGDFLRAVFSVSCAQHVSDLHSKFTLRPHHVWKVW